MDHLLTTEDVAEFLRVDAVTVRRLINRGELIAYRIAGEFRFIQSDVENFVKSQRVIVGSKDPFDKFTERARKVLTLATDEARSYHHPAIGTEHLLLGIVSEGEGVAAKVLVNLGVQPQSVRSLVEELHPEGSEPAPAGEPDLTPRAEKSIAEKSIALTRALVNLGVQPQAIEALVKELYPEGSEPAPAGEPGLTPRAKRTVALVKALVNLGVQPQAMEALVEELEPAPAGEIGLTPRAKKSIALAVEEARTLKHRYLGTEHLLLGLIRMQDGLAEKVLSKLGVSLEEARAQVVSILADLQQKGRALQESSENPDNKDAQGQAS